MKKIQYVVVIVILILLTGYFVIQLYSVGGISLNNNSQYYTVGEIITENKVLYSGITKEEPKINVEKSRYGLTGFTYASYDVTGFVDNPNETSRVYNVFEVDGLDPNTTYEATISLNVEKNMDADADLLITFSQAEVSQNFNKKDNSYFVGVKNQGVENNSVTYHLFNENSYFQSVINIKTNENGTSRIVFQVSSDDSENIDYHLSNISFSFDTLKETSKDESSFDSVTDGENNGE